MTRRWFFDFLGSAVILAFLFIPDMCQAIDAQLEDLEHLEQKKKSLQKGSGLIEP